MTGTHLPGRLASALAALGALTALSGVPRARAAEPPIKIGVIAEASALDGVAILNAAKLAADDINAHGGIGGRTIQIVTYDDHSSAADAVRAFQRAVSQDHVNAVIASYVSEVALALEPWAARTHTIFITPGAASNDISKHVHDNYSQYKYVFHEWLTSAFIAQSVCDFSHDVLVPTLHMKTTAVMSEDAAWTKSLDAGYLECLPKAGLKVLDHIRFSPDTSDFTPIFNRIEGKHPDVIITGMAHVGVQPTVQWKQQQVPIAMAGVNAQATTSSFWKDTNGATEGVITESAAAPNIAITPTTIPFTSAYEKKFGVAPAYSAYSTYDAVHIIADAVKKAGSTDPDKLVSAIEKTNYLGTIGRVEFYGKDDEFTHAMKYGPGYIQGVMVQWQNGTQKVLWPAKVANAKPAFPSFVHLPKGAQTVNK